MSEQKFDENCVDTDISYGDEYISKLMSHKIEKETPKLRRSKRIVKEPVSKKQNVQHSKYTYIIKNGAWSIGERNVLKGRNRRLLTYGRWKAKMRLVYKFDYHGVTGLHH